MNLQTMSIILIIIVLPITLILTAYTKIQIDTIALQTQYRTKLNDATHDAIVAFQLNTVKNTYSTVSDSMRRDVLAVIQTFITSLATNLGMSGTDEVNIKPYIPAIVFTLYDGYYIYSPSVSHTIDGDEKNTEQKENTKYEHVLKPYIYYTARYVNNSLGIDVIVNYSLDNYVVVTGQLGKDNYVTRAGYLVNVNNIPQIENSETLEKNLPVTVIAYEDNPNKNFIKKPTIFDTGIAKMVVTNQIGMETDRYSNGYLLQDSSVFKDYENLTINRDATGESRPAIDKLKITRELLENELNKAKSDDESIRSLAKGSVLKKWYSPNYTTGGGTGERFDTNNDIPYNLGYYVEPSTSSYYIPADSAYQFYYGKTDAEGDGGAIEFTNWFTNSLMSSIKASDAVKADGSSYGFSDEFIFKLGNQNDPEDEASIFNDHRRNIIKASIQDNLSQAIASYNQNSESLGTLVNFQMPILSETEWDQVLSNVCLITFVQGMQVGTKVFNDYSIVTSTTNKEYISPDSIYYVNESDDNEEGYRYYHKIDCPKLKDDQKIVGYRNSDFKIMSYEVENKVSHVEKKDDVVQSIEYEKDKNYYYSMRQELACYDCIVNSSYQPVDWKNNTIYANRRQAYYTALARERFNFYKTNEYFNIGQ